MNIQTYFIHDNGNTPFKVIIYDNIVKIFDNTTNEKLITFFSNKIFIGESKYNPTTNFSVAYDPDFRGNSILLKLDENEYEFIGKEIFSFQTLGNIVKYESPIGNSDVSYPYAIDEFGNIYLLIEDVILKHNEQLRNILQNNKDPYDYYYKNRIITKSNFDNISEYYIDDEKYILSYTPNHDYDNCLIRCDGQKMYIVYTNGVKSELTKDMYNSLMDRFGDLFNVEKLIKQIDVKRIW